MRKDLMLFAGFAALAATPVLARSDTDYPHRDWGRLVTLDMSLIDATACIVREMNRSSDTSVIPVDGGNDIDVAPHLIWGPKPEPWHTYKLRRTDEGTTLRVFYRHPAKVKSVNKDIAKLQAHCLKVKRIDPT